MNLPLVSVVIPAHNTAGYLPETLASVAAQTYRPLEVIVIDDASTDNTARVAESCLTHYGLVGKVLRRAPNPREWAGAARNEGARLATGDYLAFLDSDDLWLPHHLARAMELLQSYPDAVAYCCSGRCFRDQGIETGQSPERGFPVEGYGAILTDLVKASFVPNITLVVRRKVFDHCGGYHPGLRCYEDWWLDLHLAAIGPWVIEPRPGCRIRVRDDSLSRTRVGGRSFMSVPMYLDRVRLAVAMSRSGLLGFTDCNVLCQETQLFVSAGLFESLRNREIRRFFSIFFGCTTASPRLILPAAAQGVGAALRVGLARVVRGIFQR